MGQAVVLDSTWSSSNVTHTITWERGDESTIGQPGYISPFAGIYTDTLNIVNTPLLWDETAALYQGSVTLVAGEYEMTIKEFAIVEGSGMSDPFTFEVKSERARIQIIIGVD